MSGVHKYVLQSYLSLFSTKLRTHQTGFPLLWPSCYYIKAKLKIYIDYVSAITYAEIPNRGCSFHPFHDKLSMNRHMHVVIEALWNSISNNAEHLIHAVLRILNTDRKIYSSGLPAFFLFHSENFVLIFTPSQQDSDGKVQAYLFTHPHIEH